MLSIGKSLRTGPERNIIPRRLLKNGGISQIVGLFSDKSGSTKAQVDMELRKSNTGQLSLVKYFASTPKSSAPPNLWVASRCASSPSMMSISYSVEPRHGVATWIS